MRVAKAKVPKKSKALVPTTPVALKQAEFDFVKNLKGWKWDYYALATHDENVFIRYVFRLLLVPGPALEALLPA